jgi:ferritin-like metal-binding protein YciE
MTASKVSNPRDLLALLLGELLHVERRLAGGVLEQLASAVADDELAALLRAHLEETRRHVDRVETAFRRLDLAPSAHECGPFEAAVAQHDELASSIVERRLADVFHAQAALHTEHWEIAAYTAVLTLAEAFDRSEELEGLGESVADERRTQSALEGAIARLAAR